MKAILIVLALMFYLATSALAEPVTRHLGRQTPTFGTVGQASALLDLIRSVPGQEDYRITYQTEADVVVFGAHLGREQLMRLHQRPDGTGTAETWTGHTMYRIEQAATGGSLNDTIAGKAPGNMTNF